MRTVTILAIALWAPALLRADDRPFAKQLADIGIKTQFDKDFAIVSISSTKSSLLTPAHYKAIGKLAKLKSLILYIDCSLTDETLALLANLPALEQVQIDGAKLTDDGMKHFATMKSLKSLTFFHVLIKEKFTGAGLVHLAELPRFESFGCGGSSFDDRGLAACAKIPGLKSLHVWHTPVTNAGVAPLKALSKLRDLRLAPQFSPRITDAVVVHLVEIPSLEALALQETRLSFEGGLRMLKKLPNLKKLDLSETELPAGDLDRLKGDLPGVNVLWKEPSEMQRKWLRQNFDRK